MSQAASVQCLACEGTGCSIKETSRSLLLGLTSCPVCSGCGRLDAAVVEGCDDD